MTQEPKMIYDLRTQDRLNIKKAFTDENTQSAVCVLLKGSTNSVVLYAKITSLSGVKHLPIFTLYCSPFVQMSRPRTFGHFFKITPIPYKDLFKLAATIIRELNTIVENSLPMNPANAYIDQYKHATQQLNELQKELTAFFEEINYPLGRQQIAPTHYTHLYYKNTADHFQSFLQTKEQLTFEQYIKRCGASLSPKELIRFDNIECVYVYSYYRLIYVMKDNTSMYFLNGVRTTRKYVTFVNAQQVYARNNLSKVEKRLFKIFLKG